MAFDVSGGCQTTGDACLYATTFNANTILVFDNTGAFLGTCGALNGADPSGISDIESATIVPKFSGGPSLFFGQADGDRQILQYAIGCSSSSSLVNSFTVCTSTTGTCPAGAGVDRGTDWVDMTSDLCNIQYTSESTSVLDYNVCTNTQEPDFADGMPGSNAYAHRQLTGGDVLVADTDRVVSLNSAGSIVNSCLVGSEDSGTLFSMDVLPDQKSFAVAQLGGENQVEYLSLSDCNAGVSTPTFSFDGLTATQTTSLIGGVAIYGEFTAAGGGGATFDTKEPGWSSGNLCASISYPGPGDITCVSLVSQAPSPLWWNFTEVPAETQHGTVTIAVFGSADCINLNFHSFFTTIVIDLYGSAYACAGATGESGGPGVNIVVNSEGDSVTLIQQGSNYVTNVGVYGTTTFVSDIQQGSFDTTSVTYIGWSSDSAAQTCPSGITVQRVHWSEVSYGSFNTFNTIFVDGTNVAIAPANVPYSTTPLLPPDGVAYGTGDLYGSEVTQTAPTGSCSYLGT